jgi:enoyl-CoA hydratase/carnithine racemase
MVNAAEQVAIEDFLAASLVDANFDDTILARSSKVAHEIANARSQASAARFKSIRNISSANAWQRGTFPETAARSRIRIDASDFDRYVKASQRSMAS